MTENSRGLVRSVKKALDLLDALLCEDMNGQGVGVSKLARRMGYPVNTTHSLLATLVICEYAEKTPAGLYRAGPKCRRMGRRNRWQNPALLEELRRILVLLAERLGESVVMTTLREGRRLVLCRALGEQAIQADPTFEDRMYRTPTGRVLLAFCEPEERDEILRHSGFPGAAWDDIASKDGLEKACRSIRESGGVRWHNREQGLVAFARPVFRPEGGFAGALGCYAPAFRLKPARYRAVEKALVSGAAEIGRAISRYGDR